MDRDTTSSGKSTSPEAVGGSPLEHDESFQRALAGMPETRRAIFLAATRDGLSYAEIAKVTGFSVRRVEREVAAALLQLDDAFAGRKVMPSWSRLLKSIVRVFGR